MSKPIVTPNCPGCGQPPVFGFAEQCFCGTDDCRVLQWNPTEEILDMEMTIVDLPDLGE